MGASEQAYVGMLAIISKVFDGTAPTCLDQPRVEGRLIEDAGPQPHQRLLH
jgi:hypothetical protein